jgi:hypothetical protein
MNELIMSGKKPTFLLIMNCLIQLEFNGRSFHIKRRHFLKDTG